MKMITSAGTYGSKVAILQRDTGGPYYLRWQNRDTGKQILRVTTFRLLTKAKLAAMEKAAELLQSAWWAHRSRRDSAARALLRPCPARGREGFGENFEMKGAYQVDAEKVAENDMGRRAVALIRTPPACIVHYTCGIVYYTSGILHYT